MNQSSLKWSSRVILESVESCEWGMWMCHANESCEWVISCHRVTPKIQSCIIGMWHITHMNMVCHTHVRVMSQVWMNHDEHMNASCHTYEQVMSHFVAIPRTQLKISVSFAEYSLFYRALLQKRPINFKEPTNCSHPIAIPRNHRVMSRRETSQVTHVNESCRRW